MRSLLFTLTLALAATLAACGGSSTAPEKPADTGAAPANTEVAAAPVATEVPPTASPTEAPAAVGADVVVGGVTWNIAKAEDKGQKLESGNQYIDDKTTSGRFIRVEAKVTNNGKEEISISGPKVKDSTGREFDISTDASMVVPDGKSCIFESANPGISKECVWVYEVPADAKGLMLQAGDGQMFGGADPVGIDLGL